MHIYLYIYICGKHLSKQEYISFVAVSLGNLNFVFLAAYSSNISAGSLLIWKLDISATEELEFLRPTEIWLSFSPGGLQAKPLITLQTCDWTTGPTPDPHFLPQAQSRVCRSLSVPFLDCSCSNFSIALLQRQASSASSSISPPPNCTSLQLFLLRCISFNTIKMIFRTAIRQSTRAVGAVSAAGRVAAVSPARVLSASHQTSPQKSSIH